MTKNGHQKILRGKRKFFRESLKKYFSTPRHAAADFLGPASRRQPKFTDPPPPTQ